MEQISARWRFSNSVCDLGEDVTDFAEVSTDHPYRLYVARGALQRHTSPG
jgi:hypothetical protein